MKRKRGALLCNNVLDYYERLYLKLEPAFAYKCRTILEHKKWERKFRVKLRQLLGGFPKTKCPLNAKVVDRVKLKAYTREKIIYQSIDGVFVSAYVLIPHNLKERTAAVVALPGHIEDGKESLANIFTLDRKDKSYRSHNYGHHYGTRGYVVIAPDQACFGERFRGFMRESFCYQESVNALILGKTIIGLRVYEAMRAVDYLKSRPDVAPQRIGCVGLSGGGTTTLFTTALDKRIKAAVVSGYFCTFHDSIMAVDHCICNFIPGILQYAEMADIACLIAPRPLLIETGTSDEIFPTEATQKAYAQLKKAYKVLKSEKLLDINIFRGGHVWHGKKSYSWFNKYLK